MTEYRFRQGIDYGPRDGTLGISYHMSEGGDNLVSYLARRPGEDLHQWADRVNGVSCNAALLSDGTIWRMLPWDHASGNLNPGDRAGEYGYYGGHHLRAVLGSYWPDPNAWTVSMEIAGRRAVGPTPAQVTAAVRWGLEMRARFPTIRGATGHHDQSPKACPGPTAAMKAIFAGVGGHGLFATEDIVKSFPLYPRPTVAVIREGAWLYDNDALAPSAGNVQVSPGRGFPAVGRPASKVRMIDFDDRSMWVKLDDCLSIAEVPPVVVPPPDCTSEVNAAVIVAVAEDRAKARVVWGPV
jgi:hypothetical protein